jgi:hypothetical protein
VTTGHYASESFVPNQFELRMRRAKRIPRLGAACILNMEPNPALAFPLAVISARLTGKVRRILAVS